MFLKMPSTPGSWLKKIEIPAILLVLLRECYIWVMAHYSNARALRALFTASLQSMLKSPSAVFFSIAFPLVFIMVFGFFGNKGDQQITIASARGSDTTNELYHRLKNIPALRWKALEAADHPDRLLSDGSLSAIVKITAHPDQRPRYILDIRTSTHHLEKLEQLQALLLLAGQSGDAEIARKTAEHIQLDVHIDDIKAYKPIDFILPGQLGFSLLAAGVFGTAFVFFNLRQTLVLKRFFATPVRREIIILSEGLSRMFFQLTGAIIIIGIGYFVFDFTLINGWITFFQMLLLCALGLMVFMGFGFIVSSLARHESTIPPLSNILTLPQFLLAGTFFPIEQFPDWLQPLCRILPLTWLNDALRKIAFDHASLGDISLHLVVLTAWGIVTYVIAAKIFKWE